MGRVERRYSRAAGAHSFGQRALRIQFDFEFTTQRLLLEKFVFADVAGDHLAHLARLEQQPDAEIGQARIIGDDGEILDAGRAHRGNQVLRNTAQPEPAHENGGSVTHTRDDRLGIGNSLVHSGDFSLDGWLRIRTAAVYFKS